MHTVVMRADSTRLVALLDEIAELTEPLELLPEVRDRLVGFFESADEPGFIEGHSLATAGANEVFVRLDPGDRLLRFAAALRAGDLDLALVESTSGHGGPPCVNG